MTTNLKFNRDQIMDAPRPPSPRFSSALHLIPVGNEAITSYQDSTNGYSAITQNLKLTFKEKQQLNKILCDLICNADDPCQRILSVDQLSGDKCSGILRQFHASLSHEQEKWDTVLDLLDLAVSERSDSTAQVELGALNEVLNGISTQEITELPPDELRHIRNAYHKLPSEFFFHDANKEFSLLIGQETLNLKQCFLNDLTQVSIWYEDHPPCVINKFSLRELMKEINGVLKEFAFEDNPPIREINHSDVVTMVQIVEDNMNGWNTIHKPRPSDLPDTIDPKDWKDPKRTVRERWNVKLWDTRRVLGCIKSCTEVTGIDQASLKYYVYEVDNIPVGFLVLNNKSKKGYENYQCIEQLVVHPGTEGGGGSLVEFAVLCATESGKEGKLYLDPIDEAIPTYLAMGFERQPESEFLVLDPADSDKEKWELDEDFNLKIIKHMNKQYRVTAFKKDNTLSYCQQS